MKIDSLNLKPKTYSALIRSNLVEVEQLQAMSDKELLDLDGIGTAAVKEIRDAIAALPQESELAPLTDTEVTLHQESEEVERLELEPKAPVLTLEQVEVGQQFRFVDAVNVLRDRRPDDIYQRVPSARPVGVEIMNLRSSEIQPLATFNEAAVELV